VAKRSKRVASAVKEVNPDHLIDSLARAVADGDFVSFRTLFLSFSPGRTTSSQSFDDEKYGYLKPSSGQEDDTFFAEARAAVKEPETWQHIQRELDQNRPAQLPAKLLMILGDNAIRLGQYTNASQAYEMLRIRKGMQEEFYTLADEALESGDISLAVRGYRIATSLDYDYAAFPEPLPKSPSYQSQSLMLHGTYPSTPEESLCVAPEDIFLPRALTYLLDDAAAAARIATHSQAIQIDFLAELIAQIDPEWAVFRDRYHGACEMVQAFGARVNKAREAAQAGPQSLAEEIEDEMGDDPIAITAHLLGRTIEDGAWWQYLKEMAFEHPAAALFVSRQLVGDHEILVPRIRSGSPIVARLDLAPPGLKD
jgi:hypothetical protein